MSGCLPIVNKWERVETVRFHDQFGKNSLNPTQAEPVELGDAMVEQKGHEPDQWEPMAKKVEELGTEITAQFEDENDKARAVLPIAKAQVKPTHDEWERHQVTHALYAPWCPHCLAARNARRGHPTHGRKGTIAPDIESGEGSANVHIGCRKEFYKIWKPVPWDQHASY